MLPTVILPKDEGVSETVNFTPPTASDGVFCSFVNSVTPARKISAGLFESISKSASSGFVSAKLSLPPIMVISPPVILPFVSIFKAKPV